MITSYYLYNHDLLTEKQTMDKIIKNPKISNVIINFMLNPTFAFSIDDVKHELLLPLHFSKNIVSLEHLRKFIHTHTDFKLVDVYGNELAPVEFDDLIAQDLKLRLIENPNDLYNNEAVLSLYQEHYHTSTTKGVIEQYVISNRENYQKAWDLVKEIMQTFPNASFPANQGLQTQILQMLQPSVRLNLAAIVENHVPLLFELDGIEGQNTQETLISANRDLQATLSQRIFSQDFVIEKWTDRFTLIDTKTQRQHLYDELMRMAKTKNDKGHADLPAIQLTADNHELQLVRTEFKYNNYMRVFDIVPTNSVD